MSLPEEVPGHEGTPEAVPTKTPDATLRLTADGIELPAYLHGYVGQVTVRTPNVTGEFQTSEHGLPERDFYDAPWAAVPEAGAYHGDLREGLLAISTERHPETVFEIIDERTEGDG
ncbi:hypothetical protein AArcSl_1610 [Halalkaliarchaeum desulfuricum]|uniref:Uncharacterized protein n=1 Tax=Halalkaliarchaeum desulfuricum TaxID=2055893 RepID=A0A343TJG7_9EURY|nr:hypothetical protein [Halalkaliarchaeum desulfuricum]AUX09239.1 hypothetical protein AArcSl_1610 [Halalkaliarchaeum desulfuricum]